MLAGRFEIHFVYQGRIEEGIKGEEEKGKREISIIFLIFLRYKV